MANLSLKIERFFFALITSFMLTACGGGSEDAGRVMSDSSSKDLKPNLAFSDNSSNLNELSTFIKASPETAIVGTNITLSASLLNQNQVIETVAWEFEDSSTLYGETVSKSFSSNGYQNISVTISTKSGESVTKSLLVNIVSSDSPTIPSYFGALLGDLNGSENIDAGDLEILQNHINGSQIIEDPISFISADLDMDGELSVKDAALYQQAIIDGWPTYISETDLFPGQSVRILLPELLNISSQVRIELNTGQKVIDFFRPMPGVLTFTAPFQSSFIENGEMEDEDVTLSVFSGNLLIETFDLTLLKLNASNNPPGKVIEANLSTLTENAERTTEKLINGLNSLDLTSEQQSALAEMLSQNLNDYAQAKSELIELLGAFDDAPLKLIDSIVANAAATSAPRAASASGVSFDTNSFALQQNLSSSQSCDVPEDLQLIRGLATTGAFSESVVEEFNNNLGLVCNAMGALIPFARGNLDLVGKLSKATATCYAAVSGIDLVTTTIEVVELLMPTLKPDLNVSSSLARITPYKPSKTSNISFSANFDNSRACTEGTPLIAKEVVSKRIEKILTRFNVKTITALGYKYIGPNNSYWKTQVFKTLKSVEEQYLGLVTDQLSALFDPMVNKLCEAIGTDDTFSISVPSCDQLLTTSFAGAGSSNQFNSSTGEFTSLESSSCDQGDVRVSGTWMASAFSNIVATGTSKFEQSCEVPCEDFSGVWPIKYMVINSNCVPESPNGNIFDGSLSISQEACTVTLDDFGVDIDLAENQTSLYLGSPSGSFPLSSGGFDGTLYTQVNNLSISQVYGQRSISTDPSGFLWQNSNEVYSCQGTVEAYLEGVDPLPVPQEPLPIAHLYVNSGLYPVDTTPVYSTRTIEAGFNHLRVITIGFKNYGAGPWKISDISLSSDLSIANGGYFYVNSPIPEQIGYNETASFDIGAIAPIGGEGVYDFSVTIVSNDPIRPTQVIYYTVNVLPYEPAVQ